MTVEARQVLLRVSCPGCKAQHDIAVNRDVLKRELEAGGDVELYCITSDRSWCMSYLEKRNTRNAFAKGIL
jgi:hypothetical protein